MNRLTGQKFLTLVFKTETMPNLIGLAVLTLLLVVLISSGIRIYNRLVMLNLNVDKAFANIDVLLKQRADELPELVKVVKKYIDYEETLLTKVTAMRTEFLNTKNQDKKIKAYNELSAALPKIIAISENYPALKASSSFVALQQRASEIEDHISDRRELFNDSINLYNIGINEFPALLMAKPLGYVDKLLLQISDAEKQYDGIQF